MTIYYVKNAGSDGLNGQSDANAWQTLSKVSGFTFTAGDSILFNRGDTWRELLTVSTSGTSGNQITYGNYGAGAIPKISGATLVTGWSVFSGNVYRVAYGGALPTQLFVDDVRQVYTAGAGTAPTLNQWNLATGFLYINIGGTPTGHAVEVSVRDACVSASQKSYFTIDGLYCDKSALNGVLINESSAETFGAIVKNCTVYGAYARGIFHDWNATYGGSNFIVENNTVTQGGGIGISWSRRGDNGIIRNNIITYCCLLDINVTGFYDHEYTSGIGIFGGTSVQSEAAVGISNLLVEGNTVHHMGTAGQPDTNCYGIWIDTVLGGTIVRYNRIYDCAGSGITLEYSSAGGEVYYNLVYRCGPASGGVTGGAFGILVSRACVGWHVYNNTIVGGSCCIAIADFGGVTGNPSSNLIKNNIAVSATSRMLRMEPSGLSNTIDFNCFGVAATGFIKRNTTTYNTYATFETAYGGTTHSVQADPLFTNAGTDDYSLQSSSTCKNAATSVSLTRDINGVTVPQGASPDVGAFEYVTPTAFTIQEAASVLKVNWL